MKKTIRLKFRDEEISVEVERNGDTIVIERDGESYSLQVLGDPGAAVPPAPASRPASSAADSTAGPAATPAVAGGGAKVTAPMTGTIKQVTVGVGDAVKEGDFVMMMEAMKMDMEISAPQAGTVGQILCQVGDSVKERQPLLTIE